MKSIRRAFGGDGRKGNGVVDESYHCRHSVGADHGGGPLSPLGLMGVPKESLAESAYSPQLSSASSPEVFLPASSCSSAFSASVSVGSPHTHTPQKPHKKRWRIKSNSLTIEEPTRRGYTAHGECAGPIFDAQYGISNGRRNRRMRIGWAEADSDESPAVRIYLQCMEAKDLCTLRRLCWSGCPPRLRGRCWQATYNYSPQDRRANYAQYIVKYSVACANVSLSPCSHSVLKMIRKDVPRTQQKFPLFRLAEMQKSFEQVMFIWAVRNPATGYTQGMTDLISPFYIAFLSAHIPIKILLSETLEAECTEAMENLSPEVLAEVEADAFWGFNAIVGSIQDHFTDGQAGIQRKLAALGDLLHTVDPALNDHLKESNLSLLEFAFKWINCLLVRELPLPMIMRLWDAYMSEGTDQYSTLHVYVCLAILKRYSPELLKMDFCDMMQMLLSPPTTEYTEDDVSELLSSAYQLQQLFPIDMDDP